MTVAKTTRATTPRPTDRMPIIAMIAVAVIIMVAAVGGFLIVLSLPPWLTTGSGTIVILLVAGLVAVMLLLYLGTMILRTAGLATRSEALGMPEGSIRALIAISLILMFAIIGVTVLYTGIGGEPIQSNGISAAEMDRLTNVDIIAITVVNPAASPGAERFNVTARPQLSQTGHDFGLQLLTTVSTLVVAVAGFYFGSRAVSQGAKTAAAAQEAAAEAAATAAAAGASGTTVIAGGSATVDGSDVVVTDDVDQGGAIEDDGVIDEGVIDEGAIDEASAEEIRADDVGADAGAVDGEEPVDDSDGAPADEGVVDDAVEVTLDEEPAKPAKPARPGKGT